MSNAVNYSIYHINNRFLLKTPKTQKFFNSNEEAKAAFDKIRKPKGKDWILCNKFADGSLEVIVNGKLKDKFAGA